MLNVDNILIKLERVEKTNSKTNKRFCNMFCRITKYTIDREAYLRSKNNIHEKNK